MSLYLTIFEEETELIGWVFGHYSDFGFLRDKAAQIADPRRYPTFMNHSDSDGQWALSDVALLRDELHSLVKVFKSRPAESIANAFEHTSEYRSHASTLYDCFHVVDGRNAFDALIELCDEALRLRRPILFQ